MSAWCDFSACPAAIPLQQKIGTGAVDIVQVNSPHQIEAPTNAVPKVSLPKDAELK